MTMRPESGWWPTTLVKRAGAESLRAHLLSVFPEYMVPAAYIRLERFPLTMNGKLDRRALPAPDGDAYVARMYEAPVGEIETALANIWAKLLGVEDVGRHDSFFDLGGHSLMAMRLVSRLRQMLGVEVAVNELFANPVLRDFARVVERSRPNCAAGDNACRTRGAAAAFVRTAAVVVPGADGRRERGL